MLSEVVHCASVASVCLVNIYCSFLRAWWHTEEDKTFPFFLRLFAVLWVQAWTYSREGGDEGGAGANPSAHKGRGSQALGGP